MPLATDAVAAPLEDTAALAVAEDNTPLQPLIPSTNRAAATKMAMPLPPATATSRPPILKKEGDGSPNPHTRTGRHPNQNCLVLIQLIQRLIRSLSMTRSLSSQFQHQMRWEMLTATVTTSSGRMRVRVLMYRVPMLMQMLPMVSPLIKFARV